MSRTMGRVPSLVELDKTQKALLDLVKTSIKNGLEQVLSSPCVSKAQTNIQGLREQIIANITVLVSERYGGVYDFCGVANAAIHVITSGSSPKIVAHVFIGGDGSVFSGRHFCMGNGTEATTTEALTNLLHVTESMLESQYGELFKGFAPKKTTSFRESSRTGGVFFRSGEGEGSTQVALTANNLAKTGDVSSTKGNRPSDIIIPDNNAAPVPMSSSEVMWGSDCVSNESFQLTGSFRGQISPADSGYDGNFPANFIQINGGHVVALNADGSYEGETPATRGNSPVQLSSLLQLGSRSPNLSFDSDTTIVDGELSDGTTISKGDTNFF